MDKLAMYTIPGPSPILLAAREAARPAQLDQQQARVPWLHLAAIFACYVVAGLPL